MPQKYFTYLLLLCSMGSCKLQQNSIETDNNSKPIAVAQPTAKTSLTPEEFRNLSPEEQWLALAPWRRNMIRKNPTAYKKYAQIAAKSPNLEPEPEIEYINDLYKQPLPAPPPKKTLAQWWESFSEERKNFMKQNPNSYPEFKPFFNKP